MSQGEKSCGEVSNWQLNSGPVVTLITFAYKSFVRESHIGLADHKELRNCKFAWGPEKNQKYWANTTEDYFSRSLNCLATLD